MTKPAGFPSRADLHARFLEIRQRIETHARIYFRHVRCWFKRADYIAETVALARVKNWPKMVPTWPVQFARHLSPSMSYFPCSRHTAARPSVNRFATAYTGSMTTRPVSSR